MAHVKVVRRSMGKDEWIALRGSWIARRIVKDCFEINGWMIKEARQVGEMEYEYYDNEFRSIEDGEIFFSPDGTCFFKNDIEVPEALNGKKVYFQFKTAAEMMVKVNGKWQGGVDPNRDRMLISECCRAGEHFTIEMEGYNRSKPDDERNPQSSALRGCRQVFNGGNLITINDEIQAASYDVNILIETINCEYVKEEIRDFIRTELDKALNLVDYDENDESEYLKGIIYLRSYIKQNIYENNTFGKIGNAALVAHSHLDIAYFWRRIHTVQKNARTCLIQLRLMDKYPDFKYCHSQAYTYELLEKHYPEIFEEVKKRVEEGRFELAGAMYVEPDCNVPSAESLIRQCMYGQHYFRSRFNKTVDNCWLPDVFGNSWILPQILKKSGIKYFVSNKMSTWNDTNRFPHNHFIWKGIDGSEVQACVPPTHFISWNSPEQIIENWESFQDKEACKETLSMFGYGDGGSGATEQMIEYMHRLENLPGMPNTRHVRADQFLKESLENNNELETWDGELYLEMHRGTFTTKGKIKKWNRKLETSIRDTEMMAAFASLQGYNYPADILTECWKKLLINQFHDILPGTHIPPVTRDAIKDYESLYSTLSNIFKEAVGYLSLDSEASKEGQYSLLNTLSWNRSGVEFIEGEFSDYIIKGFTSQPGVCNYKKGIWVDIENVLPIGTKAISIEKCSEIKEDLNWFNFENSKLTTPLYDVKFDTDGSIISLIDKNENREIVQKNSAINKIKIYHDNPGMYDAWDILKNYKDKEDSYEVSSELSIKEIGPLYITLQVEFTLKNSTWLQTIRFFKNNPRIDFEHNVDWKETNRLAKAEFNFNILSRYAKCDTGAGTIIRDTHQNTTWQKARFEVCHHKWADISENNYGISIINDCKYGISFDKNQAGLSLLRGSIRPDVNSDKEIHTFSYALLPHKNSPEEAGVVKRAYEFNTPLYLLDSSNQKVSSFIETLEDNIFVQSVKRPENENEKDCLIVRLIELKGQRGNGKVKLFKDILKVDEMNLLEDECKEHDFSYEGNILSFNYNPFEIVTFKIKL